MHKFPPRIVNNLKGGLSLRKTSLVHRIEFVIEAVALHAVRLDLPRRCWRCVGWIGGAKKFKNFVITAVTWGNKSCLEF